RQLGNVAAVKVYAAGGRVEVASQAVEERRFAGAVGADQPQHLAAVDGGRGVVDRLEGTKRHADVARLKQHGLARRLAALGFGGGRRAGSSARMPLGRKRAISTMMAP